MAKAPPGDFKVTTPENLLLSQQAVTSKGIPIPYTNLQLNPYPNTQLDLFCSDNLSFWCTTQYLTNQLHGSQYVTSITNLKRLLATKFFSSSRRWRSKSSLVTKPYGAQTQQLLHKKDELGQILSSVIIFLNKLCSTLVQVVSPLTALKIILLYV